MNGLFSSAYWPNLHYMYYILQCDSIYIEKHEHYQKQSYRNRCTILSANGPLNLSIPVIKNKTEAISKIQIASRENWRNKHWRAICSAYNNSPYFEYFEYDLKSFYDQEYTYLFEYNLEQLNLILKLLRIPKNIQQTNEYIKSPEDLLDLRSRIDPKMNFEKDPDLKLNLQKIYYQTFSGKFQFVPNLSILDLLFNKGLESIEYLNP